MIPIVLSGGSGTRLWPVSRTASPKQFCDLFEESLLAKTLRRVRPLGEPLVIGSVATAELTCRVLRDLDLPAERAIFEPVGRNTAPAVALACHLLLARGEGEETVGVFPADHLIADEAGFVRAVRLAARAAGSSRVATLGIRPSAPSRGYGYIELGDEVLAREEDAPAGGTPLTARAALGFREKPDRATAERYVASGRFVWNAGMFVFRARAMAENFARWMPALWEAISEVDPDLSNLAQVYDRIEPESLDYGIMERLGDQVSVPVAIGWSDVGSWDEIARLGAPAGGPGERVIAVGARGNHVVPHRDRLYALLGVDDLVVVDTADALLVARRGTTERVKEVVAAVRDAGGREADEHVFEDRPWGRFEILRDEDDFKSKVIRVDPGQRLSYQSHRHRSEHWVIVRGRPEVVLDDEVVALAPGDHIFIPQGAKHRIRNPGTEPVLFVEVQLGSYFGEDDIERYDDDYDRA